MSDESSTKELKKKDYIEIIKSELEKCAKSPIYFFKKYVKIQHPIRGEILFDLYPFQEKAFNDLVTYKYNIILKSRQMGISTLTSAYALWMMIFHKNKNIIVISYNQEVAKELVIKVRYANEKLPPWLKIECVEDNRLSLKFKNGSRIKAVSTTGKSGASFAASLLIIDECALIDNAQELWTAAQPTLSTGGKCVILSCVTKDTMVVTTNGIQEVGEFINYNNVGGYEIQPYNILGVNGVRSGNLFHNNGKQPTLKLYTKFSNLECTRNHKLWAYSSKLNKFDWIDTGNLTTDDYLSIQYGNNIWGNQDEISDFYPSISNKIQSPFNCSKLTPDLCYLLGLYISEGSTYKVLSKNNTLGGGSLTITCGDDISWVFDKLNLTYNCWDGMHYTVSNKNLIEFLEYLGFNLEAKANTKIIPSRLLKLGSENTKWLLRGIFDGDGSATKRGVNLTSTSKKLIDQVRMILLNFGVLTTYSYESVDTLNRRMHKIKFNHDCHRLEIYGKNAIKFYNLIGFNLERKQNKRSYINHYKLNSPCTNDIIPNSIDLVKMLVSVSGLTCAEIKRRHNMGLTHICNKTTPYHTVNISRNIVLELYSLFHHLLPQNDQEYWNSIINENITWVKIKDIQPSENETFDFSLPDNLQDKWCHSVLYNGIIGHQTPRGIGNFFHKMWLDAEACGPDGLGKNEFHAIKLPWNLHPERDEDWRRTEGAKIGSAKLAAQEYDCDFLTSGDNVIDLNLLEYYKTTRLKDPVDIRGVDKGLWVWKFPDYSHSYVVCADVARGDGSDYSACHVLDLDDSMPSQVAEYKGQLGTKEFGNFLVSLATEYNNALLIIERENVGWAVIQAVLDRGYPNLFYSSSDVKYVDVAKNINNKIWAEEKKLVPGFSTNIKTRLLLIEKLCQYISELGVELHSKRLISELETFIWKNNKAQAMEGRNDDLIMSLAMGLWIRDTAMVMRTQGVELLKATLNSIKVEKSDALPVYNTRLMSQAQQSWHMPTGNSISGQNIPEDLKWLIS